MKKKIQFSLVYRDMWQSSGKFQPRKDQLERIAPAMGEQFNQEFLRQLRLVLTRTELKSYRDGFQTGAQLMLSMLEDCGS